MRPGAESLFRFIIPDHNDLMIPVRKPATFVYLKVKSDIHMTPESGFYLFLYIIHMMKLKPTVNIFLSNIFA